jgi:DNA-binding CsgD family transcriptional regulator
MGKSQHLRHADYRNVFQLQCECCELGADAIAWRRHMVAGLRQLLRAQVAIYQELQPAKRHREHDWLIPLLTVDMGWSTDSDRSVLDEFWRRNEHELCPWFAERNFHRVFHPTGRLASFSRRALVSNADWYRGEFFNDYVRRACIDDMLLATYDTGSDATHGVVLHRALRDRPFRLREHQLLGMFFAEQARCLGTRLACRSQRSVVEFPPRLQQVLMCLMEGDSEKQIAQRLGITQHTVHYHVRELYRRFGVSSRGQLLAEARPYWAALQASAFL